jgi:hypothetical protein
MQVSQCRLHGCCCSIRVNGVRVMGATLKAAGTSVPPPASGLGNVLVSGGQPGVPAPLRVSEQVADLGNGE